LIKDLAVLAIKTAVVFAVVIAGIALVNHVFP